MTGFQENPELDELVHYGIRGMRWGTRRAYSNRVLDDVKVLDKVASGQGSKREKFAVGYTSSVRELHKGSGIKGAAAIRSSREKAHVDRLMNGKATTKDILTMVGRVSIKDIVRGGQDKNRKS